MRYLIGQATGNVIGRSGSFSNRVTRLDKERPRTPGELCKVGHSKGVGDENALTNCAMCCWWRHRTVDGKEEETEYPTFI